MARPVFWSAAHCAPLHTSPCPPCGQVEELLREAYTLAACLSKPTDAKVLEQLLPKRFKQYAKGVAARA